MALAIVLAGTARDGAAQGPGAPAFAAMQKAWSAGDLDEAIDQADQVMKAEPRHVGYLGAIGALYCEKAQKANVFTKLSWAGKCRSTWEQALVIDSKNVDVRFMLIQYYLEAPGIAGGGTGKANEQAGEIAKLDAARGEIARGHIARSEKQLAEAEQHYRRAMDIDLSGMRGSMALASFLANQKRWADARAIFEQRLAKSAADQFAVFQLARLRQAEGTDLAQALTLFDRFLAGQPVPDGPSHTDAWFRKGQVLDKMGKKTEAIAAFKAVLTLTPKHGPAQAELTRLKG